MIPVFKNSLSTIFAGLTVGKDASGRADPSPVLLRAVLYADSPEILKNASVFLYAAALALSALLFVSLASLPNCFAKASIARCASDRFPAAVFSATLTALDLCAGDATL